MPSKQHFLALVGLVLIPCLGRAQVVTIGAHGGVNIVHNHERPG